MGTLNTHGRSRSHRRIGRYALLVGGILLLVWPTSLVYAVSPVTFSYTSAVNAPVGIGPVATAVADLNGDGKADLVVANHGNNTVSVLLGKGDGSFTSAPGTPIIVGAGPAALALADLNGDGKKDLVVLNKGDGNFPGTVSVLLGNGNGTFTQATGSPITVGVLSTAIAIGDLNGDGRPDLVVTNPAGSGTVSVLLGNGNGTFQTHVDYATGAFPIAVAIGDLNGDGHPDLVVANQADYTLSVLLGNGSGAFAAAPGSPITLDNRPNVLVLGDLNGDGRLDIVTGTEHPRGRIYSLLGKGDGTFFAPVAAPPFSFQPFTSVAIGEIDGNTKPDILATGTEANVVDVLHGNGDGTFTFSATTDRMPLVGSNPTGVAIADLNGDGKQDFLVANTDDNTIGVFFGNGGGGFTRAFPALPITGGFGFGFASVAVADFNGDGKTDLAVLYGDNRLSILVGDGHGNFTPTPASPITIGSGGLVVATGDFNGDGKADLAALVSGGDLYFLRGNGNGTFNAPIITPAPSNTTWSTLTVGDLNGDGKADLAVIDVNHNTVTPLFGAANGIFTVGTAITVGATPADVKIADLNGDGKGDIVVTNQGANTVTVLLNNSSGSGPFTPASGSPITVGTGPKQVVIADLNGDGKKDLVVANRTANTVSVLLGVGNGTFTAAPSSPIANAEGNNGSLAVGDLNGDGIPDLAIPDANGDGFIDVLTGNGNGSFTANGYALGGAPSVSGFDVNGFTLADVNGDGKQDIIALGLNISVLLNTTVSPRNPLPPPKPPGSVGGLPNPRPIPPQPVGPVGGVPNPLPSPRP